MSDEEKFDFKDEDIDPEILEIVKNFNRAGITTLFSCQGHFEDSEGGMSLPYLYTESPVSPEICKYLCSIKYPLINIEIYKSLKYDDELEEFPSYKDYIQKIKTNLENNNTTDAGIRIGWNDIYFNLSENIHSDANNVEVVFEFIRKEFLKELLCLSEDLLNISQTLN